MLLTDIVRALTRMVQLRVVAISVALLSVGSCASERKVVPAPPLGSPPMVLGTIVSRMGGKLTGAVGLLDCSVVLADANAGTLVSLDSGGHETRRIRVTEAPLGGILRLERGDSGHVLVWADVPGFLKTVNLSDGRIGEIPVPLDEWGLRMPGPTVQLRSSFFALARLGDGSWPRREPDSHATAFRLEIVDSLGNRVEGLGPVMSRGGQYGTWMNTASAVGVVGDTIVEVDLNSARVYRYARSDSRPSYSPLDSIALPLYFVPQPAREIRRTPPGLQGEFFQFLVERQLEAADIDPRGRIYAIRNRQSVGRDWSSRVEQSLEIYGPSGRLLGSFRLPLPHMRFLKVDGESRLLFRGIVGQSSVVIVTENPLGRSRCGKARYRTALR